MDLTGQKFGRLTVIELLPERKNAEKVYKCLCDCGNYTSIRSGSLKQGLTRSCGCLGRERIINANTTHGKRHTRIYGIWKTMKTRCYNKHSEKYKNYGSRSIVVCDEWKHDFEAFYNWAMDNNYRDDLTIDRIDNNKGYSPDNCKWSTPKQQVRNRRNTVRLTYNGETKSLAEWSEILNLNYHTVYDRYKHGWNTKDILFGKENK